MFCDFILWAFIVFNYSRVASGGSLTLFSICFDELMFRSIRNCTVEVGARNIGHQAGDVTYLELKKCIGLARGVRGRQNVFVTSS